MTLISMEMSTEEAKEEVGIPAEPELPRYPWGLQLCLNDEVLQKLGITTLPTVGATMMLMAKVEVTGTRESQRQGGDAERSVDLQVTDMTLGAAPVGGTDPATALYGGYGGSGDSRNGS